MPKKCLNILADLKLSVGLSEAKQERLENIQRRLEEAELAIEEGRDSDAVEHTKVAQQLIGIEEKIANKQEQIRTGEYEPKPPKKESPPSDVQKAKIDLRRAQADLDNAVRGIKPILAKDFIFEFAVFSRAMKVMADFSGALRQGLFGTLHMLKRDLRGRKDGELSTADIYMRAFRAFVDRRSAEYYDLMQSEHPQRWRADKAGLYRSPLEAGPLGQREEYFMDSIAVRIPGIRWVREASERHFTTILNLLRDEMFFEYMRKNPTATDAELETYATWVNWSSGRGDIGNFGPTGTKVLNSMLFSPRFAMSRFQTVAAPYVLGRRNKNVRKEIAKDWLNVIGMGMGILAMAKAAGADVGDDPLDPDFGKIVVGNTRVDIWAGHVQVVRLLLQTGMIAPAKRGAFGEKYAKRVSKRELKSMWGRFLSYKLAPLVTIPLELYEGKTAVGEDRAAWETLMYSMVPIVGEDIIDVAAEEGDPAKAAAIGAAAIMGLGTNTYQEALKHKDLKPLFDRSGYRPGKPKYPEGTPRKTQREFNEAFESILAKYIRADAGYLNTLSDDELKAMLQAYAEQARAQVISSLPVQ